MPEVWNSPNPADADAEVRRLRHLVDATPNAMILIDRRGAIVLVNAQAEVLFDYTRDELLGMTVESLIPERLRHHHVEHRSEYLADPRPRPMGAGRDLYARRRDGTEVPVEIGLSPLHTDEGDFALASVIDITERKRFEERMLQVVEAAPNAMVMVNERGEIVLVNSQTEASFGYTRDELVGMHVEELIPERYRDNHQHSRRGFFAHPDKRAMGAGRDLYGRRKDGSEIPIEIGLNPISIMDENLVLASIIDITERITAQAVANATRFDQLRRTIFDSLPLSIVATDATGEIVTANPAAEKLLGRRRDELIGSPIHLLHDPADGHRGPGTPMTPTGDDGRESVYRRKDGTTVPVNEAVTPLHDGSGETTGFLTVAYDITKRKQAQEEVRHLAHHDVLTDLPNRTLLFDHLRTSLRRAARDGTTIAVLMLDVDHFKRVNDSLGHHIGDDVLLQVSARLQEHVRIGDLVSRLGGDEFVVVFNDVDEADDLTPRIDELLTALAEPLVAQGHELLMTASMGGVLFPRDGVDAPTLLKNADTAMYHAKVSGRNNFQWFFPALLDDTNDKVALASELRHALAHNELSLVYQPQIRLDGEDLLAVEALARWESARHGWVGPERFIPVAEDSGMIVALGEWVLHQACSAGVRIAGELGRPVTVAVNVSPRQFRNRQFLATVEAALHDSGLGPANLELEITEGILMDEPAEVIAIMHQLRAMGIGVVVDDFGTGYSSLSYLTRFPIDKIKIDRSFIHDLEVGDADAAIVDTIIAMAHTLNMPVIAEGVETLDQQRYLSARGCDVAQGFLYSPGVPVEALAQTLAGLSKDVRGSVGPMA